MEENQMGGNASPADLALLLVQGAYNFFKTSYPAPYEWPSETGRVNQLLADTINTLSIIKEKENLTKNG